jgi:hypothetical protein
MYGKQRESDGKETPKYDRNYNTTRNERNVRCCILKNKKKTEHFSETWMFNYQTKLCHIPADGDGEEGTNKCRCKQSVFLCHRQNTPDY